LSFLRNKYVKKQELRDRSNLLSRHVVPPTEGRLNPRQVWHAGHQASATPMGFTFSSSSDYEIFSGVLFLAAFVSCLELHVEGSCFDDENKSMSDLISRFCAKLWHFRMSFVTVVGF
jgi:hypothetical protein